MNFYEVYLAVSEKCVLYSCVFLLSCLQAAFYHVDLCRLLVGNFFVESFDTVLHIGPYYLIGRSGLG